MTTKTVELLVEDIDGIGRSDSAGIRLKVRFVVNDRHTAHNITQLLHVLPDADARRKVFDALFSECNDARVAAEASLRDIHADEDAQAEREHEEWERQQAIKQGPHEPCEDLCCKET